MLRFHIHLTGNIHTCALNQNFNNKHNNHSIKYMIYSQAISVSNKFMAPPPSTTKCIQNIACPSSSSTSIHVYNSERVAYRTMMVKVVVHTYILTDASGSQEERAGVLFRDASHD